MTGCEGRSAGPQMINATWLVATRYEYVGARSSELDRARGPAVSVQTMATVVTRSFSSTSCKVLPFCPTSSSTNL